MENFLLVRPSSNYIKERILPPLDLIYTASILENKGFEVQVIDMLLTNYPHEEFIKTLEKLMPDFIIIHCDFINFNECKIIAKIIKNVSNKNYIILVGPLPSSFPYEIMKEIPEVDFCIAGEEEKLIVNLINNIKNKKSSGKFFRKNNNVFITQKCNLIKNLDSISFPARHLIPINNYRYLPHEFQRTPITTMICSRGCLFNCTFCPKPIFGTELSPFLFNNEYRVRSPENVILEIKEVINKYSIKEILFLDDVFGLKKSWNEKFCNLLIKEELDIVWSCQTRADVINKKILQKMAKAGCWSILYGLESGNQRLLNLLNKEIIISQIKKAIKLTKNSDISVRASFILGIPTETRKELMRTIKFAKILNPDFVQFHLLAPFKRTKIYELCNLRGKIFNNMFLDYDTPYKVNFLPENFDSEEELIKIQKFAYRSFYFNPKKILEIVLKIKSLENLKSCINVVRLII